MTTKAMAYMRVSGRGQVTGHGFDRQLDKIQAFCQDNGYDLVDVFREQVSGTTNEADREQFTAMVRAILSNGVKTIIVESLDRLAREYRIQEQLLVYLAAKDIDLISANTGENVTKAISEDPMKKALIQIQGIFAELDKSLTVKKLRNARERVRQQTGKCEGRKSYVDSPKTGVKEVVDTIKRMRRKWRGKPKHSFPQIAQHLNDSGITTMDGKAFTSKNVAAILYRHGSKGRSAPRR